VKYQVEVHVMPRAEISDPAGQAVERALPGLGFAGFEQVRVGKRISMWVEAADPDAAGTAVETACEQLLANPVIEEYEILVHLDTGGPE
jgi:phosphoribosylformylglycinamidine synthase subunit PurS